MWHSHGVEEHEGARLRQHISYALATVLAYVAHLRKQRRRRRLGRINEVETLRIGATVNEQPAVARRRRMTWRRLR